MLCLVRVPPFLVAEAQVELRLGLAQVPWQELLKCISDAGLIDFWVQELPDL